MKQYRKLPGSLKEIAESKEQVFRQDIFDPSLKTHKLKGKLSGYYSFSLNNKYRIIFEIIGASKVHFHAIGTHDIYE